MYTPAAFAVTDREVLRDTIRALGAGDLVTVGPAGIESTVVPFLVDDEATTLTAHLARANPQWRTADRTVNALVTFRGPDGYVSPAWYPSKQAHGKVVPTWNYVTVQARGRLVVHDDPAWVRAFVARLTDRHEQHREQPWSIDDAPGDFIDGLVRTIVGVEIEVTELTGKWKLSQNRPEADRAGVIDGLDRLGASALAEVMRDRAG